MDPITLAMTVTSLLSPFIKKAGDAALDKLAEQLPDTVGKVWNALLNKSSNITEAASELAKNPDDADNEVVFRKQLQKALEKDQDFAAMLTDLMKKANVTMGGGAIVATNNSFAARDINISGDVNGNFTIGSNNQINNK